MEATWIPYYTVDAFTTVAFSGNPAGVCLCEKITEEQMRAIAREAGHSETAFVTPINELEGIYSLRWFTPTTEVNLCGHATLGTAHVLFNEKKSQRLSSDLQNKDS